MNTAANMPLQRNQPDDGAHVYRVSAANRAAVVVLGVVQFCLAGWLGSGLFVPHIRARFAHQGLNATADLVVTLAVLGLALFSTIRPFQMRVTITNARVEVVGAFSSQTIPFAEISGRRFAGGSHVRGMYLYRRGKSRVFVRESMLRPDNFYERWRASIYDLDMADRLKRKAVGKEPPMDYILGADDCEQHPVIGGPDTIA
jgi:hypothetical protein